MINITLIYFGVPMLFVTPDIVRLATAGDMVILSHWLLVGHIWKT